MKKNKGQMSKTERYKYICNKIGGEFTYNDVVYHMKKEFPHKFEGLSVAARQMRHLTSLGFLVKTGTAKYWGLSGEPRTVNKYKVR